MTKIPSSAAERLGALSAEQAKLLNLLLEQHSRRTQVIRPCPRAEGASDSRLPASWAQQRLWFIDQLAGGHGGYVIPAMAVRLRGVLDLEVLQQALNTLVQRHEVLRTSIVSAEAGPTLVIMPEGSFPLRLIDLSGLAQTEREAQVRLHGMEEAHEQFDLRRGPLARGRLLRLQPELHVLLITMHHIITDGWSIRLFSRELADVYTALRQGRHNPLGPLPIQYADYAQWQRESMRGEVLEQQLSYWRTRLEGAAPQLELPTDRPRPAVQSYRGGNVRVVLDAQLSAQLKFFAHRRKTTLFMVLYGALSILLSRLSGQSDVVIGTPIANRQRPELEGLLGLFVNTLVLRARVTDEVSVDEFLEQIKEVTLGAYNHHDVPLEKIVEALQPQRSLSRAPLFQVMFVLHNEPRSELKLPNIAVTLEDDVDESSILDLWMSLEERGDELVGSVNYASDLFDRVTIERWMTCLKVLLKAMVEGIQPRVGDLPILPEKERREVIEQFNATQTPFPLNACIHELFEQQVELTPGSQAVVYEREALTYAELNGRVNQLAHHLRKQGMQSGEYVPIHMPRCLQMVIAQMAVLKCGGAYVPVDPALPFERRAFMIRDCGARRILGDRETADELAQDALQWIDVVSAAPEIELLPQSNLPLTVHAEAPAYVIYTSGSTGFPKGVVVPHRAVNRLVFNNGYAQIQPTDCVSHSSNPAFDGSTFEIWAALLSGARLVVIPKSVVLDTARFAEVLREQGVNVLFLTTALFNLNASAFADVFARQRYVFFGGEASDPNAVRTVLRNSPPQNLLNMYGPTETTTYATWYPVVSVPEGATSIPIGRPIANTQIYILDNHLRPVPIGVSGEIYIGGAGVALGYLNRPELTATRFIADPFSRSQGARLYKSGDLGRWRRDGTIDFLGRNDHQVKIRGLRIELEEIEVQIAQHPQVRHAVVLAREDDPGEKSLVAYFTRRDERVPTPEELRTHLKSVLPEYMVPGAFVMLESLPLTSNGKVDRRALPAPEACAYVSRQYEAPEGEVEQILAGVWQDLLHLERVGRHDGFFELGGHSLMIVHMLERLRRVGLTAQVRDVFECTTLADLARALSRGPQQQFAVPPNRILPGCETITSSMLPLIELDARQIAQIVRVTPGGAANIQDIYPLAPLQEGILFHHLLSQQGGDPYVRPKLFCVSSQKRLQELIQALQSVIDRHDILRTAVLWERLPRAVQVVHRQAPLLVEEIALDPGRDVIEQLDERLRPQRLRLDLQHAPLMRLQVAADPGTGQWYALLQTHHLVCDNGSLDILIAEVMAHIDGESRKLPDPVPYRNHVAQALAHRCAHDAETFFRAKLGDVNEPTAPFGLLDVHGDGSQIEVAQHALERELAGKIRLHARRLGVSAATLFHAAWALVISHTSGRDDVVFGTVLLGRLQGSAGAQRILGMFINTLPLRLRLQDLTAEMLVKQAQHELIGLLDHEQTSLAVAQRCSGIVGTAPLFSALLNYRHNVSGTRAEWSDAVGVKLLRSGGATNYPILLSVDDLDHGFELEVETDRRIDPRRMLGYMTTAIRSLVQALHESPQKPALALAILPEDERRHVIELSTPAPHAQFEGGLIQEAFEQQVARAPDQVAVVHEGQSLSYGQLNAKANQIARYLRAKGVGPDQLVGICVEPGLEMVVGLLGILKAGGAYVPFDPNYPAERLQYMLCDAGPKVLLIQERLRQRLPAANAEVIAIDGDSPEISQQDPGNLNAKTLGLHAHHLAYVIYTSGSTGKPKGVMVEHRNVTRLFSATNAWFSFNEHDVWTLFHSFAFDFSVWELWGALLYGGRVVVVPYVTARSPHAFYRLLCEEGVTVLNQTPSAFAQLIEAQMRASEGQNSLRVVVFGGEALELRTLRPWIVRNGLVKPQLVNMYGITETTVHVTYHPLSEEEIGSERSGAIGAVIPDLQVYLLDRHRQLVPIGVVGEIYVGGAGVARGYLNRPDLSAARFIADPFSSDPRRRLYKSGDLGRWRADGTLEYLGRNDHQVKIRGFRIELGEIEAQLALHTQVREAVVLAREDVAGEKRLVAYVVPGDNCAAEVALSVERLREHLKPLLPDHMVPSAFVMLENLPLTANGKLDRSALPAPGLAALVSRQYEAPRGELEELLAEVWRSLLHVERVGRRDNFFELGGHSLSGMRMIARVAGQFALQLSIAVLFQYPTLQQMAQLIESLLLVNAEPPVAGAMELEEGVI